MHLHFERLEKPSSYSDCDINSLSWMGKVPDNLLQNATALRDDEGWKLNRANYYQDGWIALGNIRGIVGATYTTCRCRKTSAAEMPPRTNYNLRGHRSEVTLVKWNEPYQKLASCDSSGIIFVWIKYEGRWSIELINDRSTQVTDFAWSHDGRMALICYTDGFVLVGSVTGQRYWSSMLNLDACSNTCGVWTPDDQQVLFGTSNGHIIVIHVDGTIVAQVPVRSGVAIVSMVWSCEKFKMEDTEDTSSQEDTIRRTDYTLAVAFADGILYLMKSYDDMFPVIVRTGLEGVKTEWCNSGDLLAVAGHRSVTPESISRLPAPGSTHCYRNLINFYTELGAVRYSVELNYVMHPITAITWGHNDKRFFVSTGPVLHVAWATKRVPSLQLLSRLTIFRTLATESAVEQLVLPSRLQTLVSSLFGRTLRCYLPDIKNLRDFVSNPPTGAVRLHCTMIRHDDDLVGGSATYVLYLEYLGGLVPILKGKRASKLKPEFVIFDPQHKVPALPGDKSAGTKSGSSKRKNSLTGSLYWSSSSNPNSSDSELDDNAISLPSPLMRRRCRKKRNKRAPEPDEVSLTTAVQQNPAAASNNAPGTGGRNSNNNNGAANGSNGFIKPESTYADEMPEDEKLILINSNIWGTKFKILGLSSWLPSSLGSVTYRTSLLHLQPRQMTLQIKELGGRRKGSLPDSLQSTEKAAHDSGTNNFPSSDDEEGLGAIGNEENAALIAPMTPKKNIRGQSSSISPERKPSLYLRASAQPPAGSYSDYASFMPGLNEEMLTLQINGDASGSVTYEMSAPPPTYHHSHHHHTPPVPSSSISTQTSFQSVSELINALCTDKPTRTQPDPWTETPVANSSAISPTFLEMSTEDIFLQMAKKFASEMPCTSRSPAAHTLNFNKYELFQQASSSHHSRTTPNGLSSPLASPPAAMSPPKSLRYKMRKESPRKSAIACADSSSELSKACDLSNGRQVPNQRHSRTAYSAGTSSSGISSPWTSSSNGNGGLGFLQCSGSSAEASCLIDAKPVLYSTVHENQLIKFIDENDEEVAHEASSSAVQPPFSRSPSLFVYKSASNSFYHPCAANNSDFTNIRSTGDSQAQRRLTLKASRKSHSLDSDTPSSSTASDSNGATRDKDKPRNCMSLDEEDNEERDATDSGTACGCSATDCPSTPIQLSNAALAKHQLEEKLRRESFERISTPTHQPKKRSNFDFNSLEIFNKNYSNTRGAVFSRAVDQSTDTIDELNSPSTRSSSIYSFATPPTRATGHRGSLPHPVSGANLSIHAMPATTVDSKNRSLPASPMMGGRQRRKAQGRGLFYSPMMFRKVMKQKFNYLDCSSEDDNTSDDELRGSSDFKDLESFQKAHIKKKIKVKRRGSRVQPDPETSPKKQQVAYREFVLHNKAPFWNEVSQVYQLDFGGRVTQESAKNFQIEHQGKQVMQFGRIDGNAYTLDFQYPFSALQALAVALANVTQRLK